MRMASKWKNPGHAGFAILGRSWPSKPFVKMHRPVGACDHLQVSGAPLSWKILSPFSLQTTMLLIFFVFLS